MGMEEGVVTWILREFFQMSFFFVCLFWFFVFGIFSTSFFIRYFLHLHFKCYPQSPLYPLPACSPTLCQFLANTEVDDHSHLLDGTEGP